MIHILDKQTDTILTFLRTNVSEAIHEEDLRYTETFDFSVWMDEKAQYVSERNRAIIQADDGSYREFIIRKTQEDRNLVTAFSDASFLDLDRQRIISPVTLYGQTIESAANYILSGTEWQLGIAEHFGSQKIVFDSHIGAFQALKHIASNFNCEMRFRVEIKGNKVTGRYVDFFKRRGQFRGKEVTFGKDLMDIRRIEESADIVTALLCIGPEQQDGTRLTTTVVDNDALQRFGRNGKHLWGIYEADTNEQNLSIERLTELGQTELKKRIQSVVQYETTQAALERIPGLEHERVYLADTIRVKDTKFHPPLYLEARAIRVKRNLLDPSQKEYTLGEFIEYKEEDVRKRFIELQRLYGLRVIKSPTEPEGTLNVIWIKTGGAIEVAHTWNGIEWVKITPTEAQEVGAETPQGAQQKADQAEQSAKQHADQKAQEAEQHAKSYAGTVAEQAKQQAVTEAEQKVNQAKTELEADIALKADATWVNGQLVLKANASDVYTKTETDNKLGTKADKSTTYTKTEVDNALNSKVSVTQYNTDMSGVVTRLNSAESRITQTENEIATKVSNTQYQQDKTTLEGDISSLETRMSQAETGIQQNANQIALKANKTDVYTKTEVNNQLANKADNTTVNALQTRISEAEAQLTVQADQIATKVSQTTFTQELAKKENSVTKSNTAPSNPAVNQLWLDTSVTPNILRRWSGSAWVKATPTNAGEVGAYTKTETDSKLATKANQSDVDTLTTRISTAETSITQLSNEITLKASQSEVDTLVNRVSNTESQLTIQAGQIATKVEKDGVISAINQSAESIKITASKVDITGAVTFSSLSSTLQQSFNADGTVKTSRLSGTIPDSQIDSAVIWNTIRDRVNSWTVSGKTTINGGLIETNTIVASSLLLSDFTNLCENPDFEGDTVGSNPKGYTTNTSCRVADISGFTNGNGSNRALELDGKNGSNNDVYTTNIFPVRPGQQFFVEAEGRYLNTAGTGTLRIGFRRYDEKKNTLSSWGVVVDWSGSKVTSFTKKSGTYTVPTGTGYLQIWISFSNNGETTNKAYIDNIRINRMASAELIVDGSITANKLSVTSLSAISANLGNVTAGTITGVQINGSRFFSQTPDSTGSYTEVTEGKIVVYGKINPDTAEGTRLSVQRGEILSETFSGTGLKTRQLSITSSGLQGNEYILNNFYRINNFNGFEMGEGNTVKARIDFIGDASFRRFKGDWEAQTYNAYVLTGVEAGTGELRVTDKNGFQQTGIGYRDVRVRTTFANRVETNTDFGGFNLYLSAQSGSEVRATATGSTTTYVPVRASSFPTASSSKYKTNIEEFHEDAIAMLKDTRIYTYHLISNVEAGIYDKRKVGMIVEAAPALFRDEDAIDTYTVLSVLWRASQQQQQMIEELQKRVDDLELAWGVTE